jgi:hypothetical protein
MSTAGDHCCHNYSVIRADGRPRRKCLYRECPRCRRDFRGNWPRGACVCGWDARELLDPWVRA